MATGTTGFQYEDRNNNCDFGRSRLEKDDPTSNYDIITKINAMLDNSLDLANINSNRRSTQETSAIMETLGLTTPSVENSSNKMQFPNMFPSNFTSTPYPYQVNQKSNGVHLGNNCNQTVNTLNLGDKRYPDVTVPLRKILQSAESYPGTPQQSSLSSMSTPSPFRRSPSSFESSPTLEQALLMGSETWRNDQNHQMNSEHTSSTLSAGSDSIVSLTSLLNNIKLSGNCSDNSSIGTPLRRTPTQQVAPTTAPTSLRTSLNYSTNSLPSPTLTKMRTDLDCSQSMNSSLNPDFRWATINSMAQTSFNDPNYVDKAAKLYRNAAAFYDATCTWSGQLPPKHYKIPNYSCKVFLGGVPWDITEVGLVEAFAPFGQIRIQWPGKDTRHPTYPPKGYVYILFETEKQVKLLLQACTHDCSSGGNWYFRISSRRMRSKEVQIIPWVTSDSNFVRCPSQRLDPAKTVFVGALHGMMNAEGLGHVMNDLFGGVVYAGIDTDKYKYPIGSGRVTFNNKQSYMKAVAAAFVEIKTAKFTKKVQVDPYLEDSLCSTCSRQQGPYFCRDITCFKYYCRSCWQWQHSVDSLKHHKPLMRNTKSSVVGPSTSFYQLNS